MAKTQWFPPRNFAKMFLKNWYGLVLQLKFQLAVVLSEFTFH